MDWIVYTYQAGATPPCHAYSAFDSTADAQAGVPFTQQAAEELASNINESARVQGSGITAMALPLEQCNQPGV